MHVTGTIPKRRISSDESTIKTGVSAAIVNGTGPPPENKNNDPQRVLFNLRVSPKACTQASANLPGFTQKAPAKRGRKPVYDTETLLIP